MLSDVVEEGGEDGQQGDSGVVDVLGHTLDLLADTHKQSHAGTRIAPIGPRDMQTQTHTQQHGLAHKDTQMTTHK